MMQQQIREPEDALASLTDKQVEVLDLLVQHNTTKQIARELGIAPNTVDQRIMGVRDKWGTADRKETARVYGELLNACGKSPCGFPLVDQTWSSAQEELRDLPTSSVFDLSDSQAFGDWKQPKPRWDLEAFDERFGKKGRVVAVVGLAFVLASRCCCPFRSRRR